MNSMEQFKQPSLEEIRTQIGNVIQIQLAIRNGQTIEEFIQKHAEGFTEIVEKHPELFDEYAVNPEGVLEEVESVMYH